MVRLLLKLLALPVTGPTDGLLAILNTIREEADKERLNPDTLRRQLAALQEMLESGDIDEDTYDALEEEILDYLEYLHDQSQLDDNNQPDLIE